MTRVIADQGLKAQLKEDFRIAGKSTTQSGRIVGYFQPILSLSPSDIFEIYDWAKAEFAKEDIQT